MATAVNLEILDPQQVAGEVAGIREAIARLAYAMYEQRGCVHGDDWADWFGAEAELLQPTAVQLRQLKDRIEVRAELNGFPASEVKVSAEARQLVLTGISRTQTILRTIALPEEVDCGQASASVEGGTLAVVLPKAAGV